MGVKGRLLMGGEDAGPVTGKELLGAMRVRKKPPAIGGGSKGGGTFGELNKGKRMGFGRLGLAGG